MALAFSRLHVVLRSPSIHFRYGLSSIVKRFCTSESLSKKNEEKRLIRPTGWIGNRIFQLFAKFIRAYESLLEKRFPTTFKLYRIFTIGSREFYSDVRTFAAVRRNLKQGKQFDQLSHREIEIYFEIPAQLFKVAPILVLSTLPFTNYVIFPLIYLFPRQLLSSHFWSIQQKMEFALHEHKKKLRSYRSVFRELQAKANSINDDGLKEQCMIVLHKLGSGTHPDIKEILAVKSLFQFKPYQLKFLSTNHLSGLCRIHGLFPWGPYHRHRLWRRAGIISELDKAIEREDFSKLNMDDIRKACFLRGLNPIGMQRDDILMFLKKWITISKQVKGDSFSLLLHCPILLGYNEPTNWSLLH